MSAEPLTRRLQDARRLIEQGKLAEASASLKDLKCEGEVKTLLEHSKNLYLRKLLRQAKTEAFAAEAGTDARYRLALARLRGVEALAALAADPALPAEERELAAWAAGEVRVGLMSLRRRADGQGLAEGWLLLLRGDAARARQTFSQARAIQPRRAALGEGVACAMAGDLAEAERILRDYGPFPQSVYPATAALLRSLSQHAAGWHSHALRDILRSGSQEEVERALKSCPGERHEERGWLSLRLGDLLFAADAKSLPADKMWAQASNLWPTLLPDVLKRRFWRDLKNPNIINVHVAQLHEHLALSDAARAREALLTILGDLVPGEMPRFDGPHRLCRTATDAVRLLDPEWLLVWARCHSFALMMRQKNPYGASDFHRASGLPVPPVSWKQWKPVITRLMAELPGEPQLIALRLDVLDACRQMLELRTAIFDALIFAPDRRAELLPRWCALAGRLARGSRKILAEAERLETLFAGDLRLVCAHLSLAPQDLALRARLTSTLPGDHAIFLNWTLSKEPLPAGLAGRDDLVDCLLLQWTREQRVDCLKTLRRELRVDSSRFQRLLLELSADQPETALTEALVWKNDQKRCWQAHYTAGRLALPTAMESARRELFWKEALRLTPKDAPEAEEMRRWLGAIGYGDPTGNDDGDDFFDESELEHWFQGMAKKSGFNGGALGKPKSKMRATKKRPPAIPIVHVPPIDLEHVAAAAGCQGELALAGLPGLCQLTRSAHGPGPIPFPSLALNDEISRLKQLAPYLRSRIRDPQHRSWFEALEKILLSDAPKPQTVPR